MGKGYVPCYFKNTRPLGVISKQYKFAFIHIPKCAGTSIETAINSYCDKGGFGYNKQISGHIQHANCQELCDLNMLSETQCNEYFKFAFVRNPWDRCVSEYVWRIKQFGNFINGPVNVNNGVSHPNYTKDWVRQNVTFKDFVKQNFPYQELSYHQHMKPQSDYIYDSTGAEIDFIGRFENLEKDFSFVCKKIFNKEILLPHKFKTNRTVYTEYYDEETKQIVAEKYAKDIEYFGYKFGE